MDALKYYRQINTLLEESEEADRAVVIESVHSEMESTKMLAPLAKHREGSVILEAILKASTAYQLRRVLAGFAQANVSELCQNRFGSHVIETTLRRAMDCIVDKSEHVIDEEFAEASEHPPALAEACVEVCEKVGQEWGELVLHPQGSHVLRTVIRFIDGYPPDAPINKKKKKGKPPPTFKPKRIEMPVAFAKIRDAFVSDFSGTAAADLRELAYHACGAPVLSVMLQVCQATEAGADGIISSLLEMDGEASTRKSDVEPMIYDNVGSHVVEQAIASASSKLLLTIYQEFFRNRLLEWSNSAAANFTVQRLIERTEHEGQVKSVMDELLPHLAELMQNNRPGVALKVVEMCAKTDIGQKTVCKAMIKVLTETQKEGIVLDLLHLKQWEEDGVKTDSSPLGSRMLQAFFMCKMDAARDIMREFSQLAGEEALALAKQPAGSHVIEAFVRSEALSKYKHEFVRKLKTHVVTLAMHKNGSRVVEACYNGLDLAEKRWMVEELVAEEATLAADFYGRFALKRCRVQAFKEGGNAAWEASVESVEKKKDMFKDILGADGDFFGGGEKDTKSTKKKRKHAAADDHDSKEIDALMSKKKGSQDTGKEKEEGEVNVEEKKKKKKKKMPLEEEASGDGEDGAGKVKEAVPSFITEALEGLSEKGGKKKKAKKKKEAPEGEEGTESNKKSKKKTKNWTM